MLAGSAARPSQWLRAEGRTGKRPPPRNGGAGSSGEGPHAQRIPNVTASTRAKGDLDTRLRGHDVVVTIV